MSIAHIISGSTITVIVDFTPKAIAASHPNYERIKQLAADPHTTEDDLKPLLDIPETIKTFTSGAVYVKNGKLYLDHGDGRGGAEVRTSLGAKIMEFIRAGDDALAEPLKIFLQNVSENPDPRVQADLFDWLQSAKLPITGDGYVLAWKAVRDDYRSIHSPSDTRFDHRVGNRVEQPRDECDANPDRTCSQGLHFCAASYLSNYASGGSRIVVVKIHPRDIVSFPSDYHLRKGRACGYDIVGEVPYDKVAEYYPQGRPVFTGFDRAAAAPVSLARFFEGTLQVGHVYRARNGGNAICTAVGSEYATLIRTDGAVINIYKDGRQYPASTNRTEARDVVKEIEFDLTADDFEVGQTWFDRSGMKTTITSINGGMVSLSNGQVVWADNGRQWKREIARTTPVDLVFRAGWTPKPQGYGKLNLSVGDTVVTANGQTVKIVEIDPSRTYPIKGDNGADYSIDGGYYRDRSSPADLVRKA